MNTLTFHNDQLLTPEIEGVSYQNHTLKIQSKESMTIYIEYTIDLPTSIQYIIEPLTNVKIIETKKVINASLNKEVIIKEGASVKTFINNNSSSHNNHQEVYYLDNNASVQTGYAELSDESLEANYHYHLRGEGANAYVRMAILSSKEEKKHYEVLIKHHAPYTTGKMDNYGVVKDKGYLTIDGIGTITKGNNASESHQTNKIMVFDSECYASANPYLYIDEYDVKASHAAGVGKMDEEHLYYLESRGLTKKQSMQLITYGYLKPVIEVVDDQMIKEQFEQVLSKVGE